MSGHGGAHLAGAVPPRRRYRLADVPCALSREQVRRLLGMAGVREPDGRRNYAMLLLIASYGLRGCEVRALRLNDIDWAHDEIVIFAPKTGRRRVLPLTRPAGEAVLDYLLAGRPPSRHREVFGSSRSPARSCSGSWITPTTRWNGQWGPSGRARWLPTGTRRCSRWSTGEGLRRTETSKLDLADFGRNPAAPEFGRFGMLNVRYGKAKKGQPPRRRNVAAVMGWAVEAVADYVENVRPRFGCGDHPALWVTERGGRVKPAEINARFVAYREALGLPAALVVHSLRHSYACQPPHRRWHRPPFHPGQCGS